jgi:hypothetical protein
MCIHLYLNMETKVRTPLVEYGSDLDTARWILWIHAKSFLGFMYIYKFGYAHINEYICLCIHLYMYICGDQG